MNSPSLVLALWVSLIAVSIQLVQENSRKRNLQTELIEIHEASHERNEAIKRLSYEYYQQFQAINDRPAPKPERVYVKANCVSPSGDAGLGNGTLPGRVELDPGIVRRITAIADRWQRDFEKCSVKLEAIHQAVRN